ncbi:LPXTG cell wall anchor domain-containing protein [Streptomyces caelestis]|uniref:LPXTG-motif cell wall-anchored protein n=1 Tax=Streptomyces caelestis TaxID=36816 RepID=A0A7W9LT18_9ACTN|nr:LPXTG cell wall anchor domain-containing protein [Streptomyces caelestis]MBB5794862.1 LPXTG-motif cell wall-anchored protein [Streptomyces caelestis]
MRRKLSRGMVVAAAATSILPMYGIQAFAASHSEVSAACGESVGVQTAVDASSEASCTSGTASRSGDDREHDGYGHGSDDVDKAGYGDAGGSGAAPAAQPSAASSAKTASSTSLATTGEESGYGDDDAGHGRDDAGHGRDDAGHGRDDADHDRDDADHRDESGYGDGGGDGGYGHDESGYGEEEGGYGDTPTTKPPAETKPPASPPTTPPAETKPPITPPASSPPHTEPSTEPPSLAETGSDQQVLAASGVAALLLTSGAVLYRRGRAASRR